MERPSGPSLVCSCIELNDRAQHSRIEYIRANSAVLEYGIVVVYSMTKYELSHGIIYL